MTEEISHSFYRPEQTAQDSSNPPKKAWLIINIILTTLCAVVIIVSFIGEIATSVLHNSYANFFPALVKDIGASLVIPGTVVAYIYTFLVSSSPPQMLGVGFLGILISIPLGICLPINTVCAIIYFFNNRKNYSRYSFLNLIFATIPTIFVAVVLSLAYLVR